MSTPCIKHEPNLSIVTKSNSEIQNNVTYVTEPTNINDSSKEKQRDQSDVDLSIDIKDEPIGDIKVEELNGLNSKLTSSIHKNKHNTSRNASLKENKSKSLTG